MTSVLIVVVRFKTLLEESPAMKTLGACFAAAPALEKTFATLVWDNSPLPQPPPALHFPFEYRHADVNAGLSGAYNYALGLAEERGHDWLLLLDQDTTLPGDFLAKMREHALRHKDDLDIAIVAPTMLMGAVSVSPKIMARWGPAVDPAPGFCGKVSAELIVMNSGMMLRVAALKKIGGYSDDFWLDFSDRYVCHMLAQHGFTAWLAGEVQVQHHVSLMAGEGATSPARYQNLLGAQDAYFSLYKSPLRNLIFCVRLLRQAVRERTTHPERARLLWRHLVRRVTVRRNRRVAEWRSSVSASRSRMTS